MKVGCRWIAVLAFIMVAACDTTTRTDITDERPSLAFKNAPIGSVVLVDGNYMGLAASFDGVENVLLVETGIHFIEVRMGEKVLFSQRVFLSGQATKTFVVQ